jgi:hypothetical protein
MQVLNTILPQKYSSKVQRFWNYAKKTLLNQYQAKHFGKVIGKMIVKVDLLPNQVYLIVNQIRKSIHDDSIFQGYSELKKLVTEFNELPAINFWSSYANYVQQFNPSILEQITFLNYIISISPMIKNSDFGKEEMSQLIIDLNSVFETTQRIPHSIYRRIMSGRSKGKAVEAFAIQTFLINLYVDKFIK